MQFVIVLLVGSLSFAALALALTAAIPNADASPAIVNASILPLLFVSGIFIPLGDEAPQWIKVLGDVFPVKHFADAMRGLLSREHRDPHGPGGHPPVPVGLDGRDRRRGLGRGGAACSPRGSSAGNLGSRALC